jgi:O-6-methylguanine DNA methyltransferase
LATEFQKRVWEEIHKIPFGKTITYKEIAKKIGKPNASRAVANACGKNPTPIIRPCHRVICSNGEIGGYSAPGGAIVKKVLLEKESSQLAFSNLSILK